MVVLSPGPVGVLVPQWTLIIIAAAVIIARVNLRLRIQRQGLLSTDILMCLAWVAAVATASFDVKFALMGALKPNVMTTLDGYEGNEDDVPFILKLFWVSGVPFFTAFYLCKAALLALYLQLFPVFMVKRRIFLWITIVFIAIAYVVSLLMLFVMCRPIESNWSLDPATKCSNDSVAIIFQVTWSLHFFGDLLKMWSTLDLNVSLVIACLPSLRPYFRAKHTNNYSYNNTSDYKPTSSRPEDGGFKMMHEPYGAQGPRLMAIGMPKGPLRPLRPSTRSHDDDPWDNGKQHNSSDIELVHIKL
ncbi:hypothetical protein G7Z17_g840 [Cylindrodendrum hubeiense]|uniref:Rhodopsin domain-containing protein n=1 Tax=Cylindrodendrum hubeiense TaxID=595255 RepID=A0A9P5LD05_9HYPO|nr:hypothetical protein G7Z17_g840 [Cylindrodendrum hubeiense]